MGKDAFPVDVPAIAYLARNNAATAGKLPYIIWVVSGYFCGTSRRNMILTVKSNERINFNRLFSLRLLWNISIRVSFVLRERGHFDVPQAADAPGG